MATFLPSTTDAACVEPGLSSAAWCFLPESMMRALLVVVGNVLAEQPFRGKRLSQLLDNPQARRMLCDVAEQNATAIVADDERSSGLDLPLDIVRVGVPRFDSISHRFSGRWLRRSGLASTPSIARCLQIEVSLAKMLGVNAFEISDNQEREAGAANHAIRSVTMRYIRMENR
jgi:hypothetical protein